MLSWRRALLLMLYLPPFLLEQGFGWLANLAYGPLYRENGRIREARRQRALAQKRHSHSGEE